MAGKQIIWSNTAKKERDEILEYWIWRNKSTTYSKKLHSIFNISVKQLIIFPEIGQKTDKENVRILVVKNYFIIYEIFEKEIIISRIWDTRRNPEDLIF